MNIAQFTKACGLQRLDCDVLLAHALGCSRAAILAHPERTLSAPVLTQLDAWRRRRAAGEPLAYILQTREFWGLAFKVEPAVLVPRPETELLVEHALAALTPGGRVLDLGTGCGAIAIAMAWQARQNGDPCPVTAVDAWEAALAVARQNGAAHGVPIAWRCSDWYANVSGRFDVIVSNPPYVAEDDPHLAELRCEPRHALVAGRDGLDAIRRIISGASRHLRPDGVLLLEHGSDQAARVRALLAKAGLHNVRSHRDLAGHERITLAHRGP